MKPDAFVLAGGRASRMGVDKARVPIPYRWPMAVTVAGVLRASGHHVALLRRGPPDGLPWRWPDGGEVPVVHEPDDGDPHPLWGVAMALATATTPTALVVACDVPFLTVDDVARITAAAPQVAHDGERVHPLVAHLPTSWADQAAEAAADGRSARSFMDWAAHVRLPASHLRNVNRWADADTANPLDVLRTRLAFLPEDALEAALDGERRRLAERGVLIPNDLR